MTAIDYDRIKEHPLWETQVRLEHGMRQFGLDRMEANLDKATTRQQMTRLKPVRNLLTEWLPTITAGLVDWLDRCQRTKGPKPVAFAYLRPRAGVFKIQDGDNCVADATAGVAELHNTDIRVDASVASVIALRAMLDGVASERLGVTALAIHIGSQVEHEAKVRLWEAHEPELFYSLQDYLDRTDATSHHRRLVNINRFNHLMNEGKFAFGWTPWGPEVHLRVGIALIDNITRTTGWFETQPDPMHVFKKGQKHGPKKVIMPKEGLREWLGEALQHDALLDPEYKPTVIPPRPWEGTRKGGYWSHWVRTPRLIRFKASQVQQQERAADEYEALDMPEEYAAIQVLQEVPWRVNARVLEVAKWAVAADHGIGKLPISKPTEVPELPEADKEDARKLKAWKRRVFKAIRTDIKRVSKVGGVSRTLRIAMEYAEFERFYFPHMMDFRGRKYPIPVGLQPQGDDLARGLLEFADGAPITEESGGSAWLAVHLASAWGHDKWTYDKRIDWVHANEALFRRIAADPYGNMEWAVTSGPGKVDKPWQALAAVFDWVGFLDHGFGYVSHTPVSVDGTCNGIQHLAAMIRDRNLGSLVNLTPADSPSDIYKFVADRLKPTLADLASKGGLDGAHASYWLDLCGHDLPRSLTKRQVMVMPYGGTLESYITYTRKWLDEEHPVPEDDPEGAEEESLLAWLSAQPKDYQREVLDRAEKSETPVAALCRSAIRTKHILFLSKLLWREVGDVASAAMGVMSWLQKTAKQATEANQPIFWVTPSGFVVRHFYGKQVFKKVETRLSGEQYTTQIAVTTKDLDIKSQLQGIAPNFVHSLDAAALTKTILLCKEDGITDLTAVHDAYGTHAANMWRLYEHLRTAFVQVHECDVLGNFREACGSVLRDVLIAKGKDPLTAAQIVDERLAPVPAKGDLDLSDVMQSEYFFS